MKSTKVFAALVLGLTLAGCATAPPLTAPIAMSDETLARYKAWLNYSGPEYFAVSRDGKASGMAFCRVHRGCGVGPDVAMSFCEYNSGPNSGGCVIYAKDGKPVVDDPVLVALTPKR